MTVLENSKDRVHTYGKQAIMAVVQVVAPAFLLNALGPVIAIFNVETQLYANPEARMSKLGRLVCRGVLSVLTLPLVSTSVGEIVKVDPRIVSEDLNKFDLMVWNNSESHPIVRKGNGSFVRTNLTNTILRGAVLPYATSLRHCDIADSQKTNAYTSVGYEFLTNDWHSRILPVGLKPSKMYAVPGSSRESLLVSNLTLSRDEVVVFETLFIRAVYLYIDEVLVQHTALGGPNVATLKTLKTDCIAYAKTHDVSASGDVDHVQHLEDYVRNYFKMSSAWTTVLGARVEDIVVEAGNHFFLQERNVQCITLTLDIPLDNAIWHRQLKEENGELVDTKTLYPGSGDVIYEFDVANECGPDTCGIENRGFAPEPKVLALADCPSTSFEDIYGVELENGTSCDNSVSGSSMWLFGFGRRIEGDTFELLDPPANPKVRKARAINTREFHRASIGYFMFPPEELDQTFNAECWADSDCKEHVVLGDFGSAFQFEKNLAHSRPLLTRYTSGARVEYEILRPENFHKTVWDEELKDSQCSGKMERSFIRTRLNNVFMEDPVQVMYTAGLFYIFQNAKVIPVLLQPDSLEFQGNVRWTQHTFVLAKWHSIFGVSFAVAIVLLCIILLGRHQRISLWSARKLRHLDVLTRVLNDSATFPTSCTDLVIKQGGLQPTAVPLSDLILRGLEFESADGKLEYARVILRQPIDNQPSPSKMKSESVE
ncbi:hypothetical protein Poli38472_013391 [Pythium oligandrum]|uniref:Uncharacterized protein n=1 Tax=Pythium oligandrum TaxID=41045 RepID=A0A8K1FFR6_PYTOL|nr:hypothetical protein Poli38472_013391 [Pythium oligandrum]|eukprot:TMW57917.1 hypothetical protein Poli38472_013391 [Pythium oligandrum]